MTIQSGKQVENKSKRATKKLEKRVKKCRDLLYVLLSFLELRNAAAIEGGNISGVSVHYFGYVKYAKYASSLFSRLLKILFIW